MNEGKVLAFQDWLKRDDKAADLAIGPEEERQVMNLALKIARLRLQKAL